MEPQEIKFEVQGSSPTPYVVTFVRRSIRNLSAYCTCPAGDKGQYCKHRFNILDGEIDAIVSNNLQDIKLVQSWLPGSDIEEAIKNLRDLELAAANIKKQLTAAKKYVAKVMRD